MGLRHFMITDVSRDGTLEGPAHDLYRATKEAHADIFLIASGGVGRIEDIALLREDGCYAAIVGKAIYEGRIELSELLDQHQDADNTN